MNQILVLQYIFCDLFTKPVLSHDITSFSRKFSLFSPTATMSIEFYI